MNKLYLFEFNRKEHLKVSKVLVSHHQQKSCIDEVKKTFGDPVMWNEGYKIKQIAETNDRAGILMHEIYIDQKKLEEEDNEKNID